MGQILDVEPVCQDISFINKSITLADLTWTQSADGKYVTTVSLSSDIGSKQVLGLTYSDWSHLRPDDFIELFVSNGSNIGLMSNKNSFANYAKVTVQVVYFV